jgi:hypothetical protein
MAEMLPIFRMFAGYNAWANERLYSAAAMLSDSEYRADHGAFFGSVHGTLNHLLVGDRIWMQRLTGEGEAPARLDAILHEDFGALRAAREAEDARIVAFVEGSASTTSAVGCAIEPLAGLPISSRSSAMHSRTSSITKRTIAARCTACSPRSWRKRRRST